MRQQTQQTYRVGDTIEAGCGEDWDRGVITRIEDGQVTVAWQSCVTTTQSAEALGISLAAATLGRKGGLAGKGSPAVRAKALKASAASPHSGRPRIEHEYRVAIEYTSAQREIGTVRTLAEAKRLAREAWDAQPGVTVTITREDGWQIYASTTHGVGMRWS